MKQLPLIDFSSSFFEEGSLEDCYIIGVQHILETTLSMFQGLFNKGLKPQNISLIGKCYSTCPDTYEKMLKAGIDVCPSSFYFDPNQPFDTYFQTNIKNFLEKRKHKFSQYKKVILIDDGGELLCLVDTYLDSMNSFAAIEQTSSGIAKLSKNLHRFPIINLARAEVKKALETPFIIESSIKRLKEELKKHTLTTKKILVIGCGVIGSRVYTELSSEYETYKYDIDQLKSDFTKTEFESRLGEFDLIIGCTGTTSIKSHQHKSLKKGCILLSMSSSDREFDSVYIRKNAQTLASKTSDSIESNDIVLLNCGFPINFTGGRESESPKFIQLTRALIIISILQACSPIQEKTGYIELCQQMQAKVASMYLKILQVNGPETNKYDLETTNHLISTINCEKKWNFATQQALDLTKNSKDKKLISRV